ncbi:NosD domain-containing protein [Rhizomicrobium electricum]|uniref:Right handed beta helix domain-containing protein n=1 Tax=Rhizomicrobium electricum TaxID=480070 RepID=A0ABN1EMV4_9PROT|nr:right-handed parallel beta-helix repeat-containing protein [Rhizomicrobium electricum]NIJ46909.1 nitrous oxidase accessory protein NosD [Rhizomicrobium electricum]
MRFPNVWIFAFLMQGAAAATLTVGPGQPYALPSQAIAAAKPGDTIHILPGTYRDCAAWRTDNLTIEGEDGAVLSEAICQGAGILVVNAPRATLRGLTFEGASIPEGNGSGVRANGLFLTVDRCTFRNNQDGILAANNPDATLLVRRSTFDGNGACLPDKGCAHGIYAGFVNLFRVENSRFVNTQVGHHIKSRARRTEIIGNTIEDGPRGTSSYLVDLPNGGSLTMTGNTLEKSARSQNPTAAVSIGEEGGKRKPGEIVISGNTFVNHGRPTVFVHNAGKDSARLSDNAIKGPVRALNGLGSAD